MTKDKRKSQREMTNDKVTVRLADNWSLPMALAALLKSSGQAMLIPLAVCTEISEQVASLWVELLIATTQPTTQNKTKQNNLVGVVLLSVKKPHHTTTTTTPPPQCDYSLSYFQATSEAAFWYVALF